MTDSTDRLISMLEDDLEPVRPLPRLRSAFAIVLTVWATFVGLMAVRAGGDWVIGSLLGGAAYYPGCGLEQLLSSEIDGSEIESYYFPYAPLWVTNAERDSLLDRCEEVRDPQVDMVAEMHGVSEDRFELEVATAVVEHPVAGREEENSDDE